MLNWRDVCVTTDGAKHGTLGEMVANADSALNCIDLDPETGAIVEWHGFFIHADGEEPDWDTPRLSVDWSGFRSALADAVER